MTKLVLTTTIVEKMMKIKNLLPAASLVLLVGCTTTEHKILDYNYITTDSAPVQSSDTNEQAQIAEAATSVGHSLQKLSAIQLATAPTDKMPNPVNPASVGMAQQTSLDWNGPIEPLLKKVAQSCGYSVRVLGKQPPIPVLVSIQEKNVPVATILRDATYQVEKKATILIYPKSKTLELRYLPN